MKTRVNPFLTLTRVLFWISTLLYCGIVAAEEVKVVSITPAGEFAPPARQIVVRFDKPVVPLGEMARNSQALPISVRPPVKCQWRWIERAAIACELSRDHRLQLATRYRLRLEAGPLGPTGAHLTQSVEREFTTRRPAVKWVALAEWRGAGSPIFRVSFDQPVSRHSAREHLYFTAGKEAKKALSRQRINIANDSEEGWSAIRGNTDSDPIALAALADSKPARRWLVTPARNLPEGESMHLEVEPGIIGNGPEPGVEKRVVLAFDTLPPFRFLGLRCRDTAGSREPLFLPPHHTGDLNERCDPLRGAALLFSAPVSNAQVRKHVSFAPDLANGRKDYDPWANARERASRRFRHRQGNRYPVYFPEGLLAFQRYALKAVSGSVRDVFGRPLSEPVNFAFMTAHRLPDLKLLHPHAVLEKDVDSHVPLYVTNLDSIETRINTLTSAGAQSGVAHSIPLPEVEDIAFAVPMEVRRWLDGASGAVSGKLRAKSGGKILRGYEFFAQVTPFAVTVKLGHFSSIAWVTDMRTGEPVEGARVDVFVDSYRELRGPSADSPAPQVTDASGTAHLPGTETLDPTLKRLRQWRFGDDRLFVRIQRGEDLALLPLDQHFRVYSQGIWSSQRQRLGHLSAWGTTAQGIYRAGDTIQYKLFVRHLDTHRLTPAPVDGYSLDVFDPTGKKLIDRRRFSLSASGSHWGEVEVAKTAPVGWYRFVVRHAEAPHQMEAFRILVSDFTPSPFRVETALNGDLFRPGDPVTIDGAARLHAGGPYTQATARLSARLRARALRPKDPAASKFYFQTQSGPNSWQTIHSNNVALDAKGDAVSEFVLPDSPILYGRLEAEVAVRDERGKAVAKRAVARYAGRDRYIGLRNPTWLHQQGEAGVLEVMVVDASAAPVAGHAAEVTIQWRETYAARVKGAGNAYLTRFENRWVDETNCTISSSRIAASCAFTPSRAGRYRAIARVTDTKGHSHQTELGLWVAGSGRVLWPDAGESRLPIVAEKAAYQIGDTARFLIRNPYPGARALVTVERYGVLRSWVQTLATSTPVVEVPVLPDDLPGFYLSVEVMSPRVSAPPPEQGQVDLGKPASRAGTVKVIVDDPYKRIDVAVRPGASRYKPGDTVRVDLQAVLRQPVKRDDRPVSAPIELAVAVLDESVFDLIRSGEKHFDPYRGFYTLDSLDVTTYSLLTRLVGRQKFDKKGAATSGDGGDADRLRDLFKFVSYWNPSLPTDNEGKAFIEFQLPDNLTGWRVIAIAATPGDRLGLGQGRFEVNQPTELRPVMPNQLTEGDRFKAGFSVLNRTASTRELSVNISASGPLVGASARSAAHITLAPFSRQSVWLDLQTKGAGELTISARASDDLDGDVILHKLPVAHRRSLQSAALYGSTEGEGIKLPVAVPEAILPEVGRITVNFAPSLVNNLEGAFGYIRDYPYSCWEQRLTQGTMAAGFNALRPYLNPALTWPESPTLPELTLADARNFQAPNGGMAYWVAQNRRTSPYLSAYTALAFSWLRTDGYAIAQDTESALQDYLRRLLRRDEFPDYYQRGMAATVRAVALAALARSGALETGELERYVAHLPRMDLFGKSHFVAAALEVGEHALVDTGLDQMLSLANESAGKAQFVETLDDGDSQILSSPGRSHCAALSSLIAVAKNPRYTSRIQPLVSKLARALSRLKGRRNHWASTQENMFCTRAAIEYARVFETEPPDLTARATIEGQQLLESRFTSVRAPGVEANRPLRAADRGRNLQLDIERRGIGRLYYQATLSYAPVAEAAHRINSGIDIRREYSVERQGTWQLLESPMQIRRGEVVRVDLYLSLPAPRHFVVVDDPVPGGLEPVNRDLATTAAIDADKAAFKPAGGSWWHQRGQWSAYNQGFWSFYHKELRHGAARFFSDYLPAGDYHLSYAAQAIAVGEFNVSPVHAEEMYDPDVFGKGRPGTLVVGER